jgi:hypothetical protein
MFVKKNNTRIELKFGSFDLNQTHFKQLEDKSGQQASWLGFDIIQAYLHMHHNNGIVLTCLHTSLLHSEDSSLFDRLTKLSSLQIDRVNSR